MFTWETTSFFFSAFLSEEPLKKDQPLSAGSKDPNGTLLTGLKAKRDVVKTFAFWELLIIAQKHPERRKAIFTDIEREGGHTWAQMLNASLEVVQGINARIEAASTKTKAADPQPHPDAMEIDSLPRIAPPVKEGPIYMSSPPPKTRTEEIESYIDWGARRIGQSKHPYNPPVDKAKGLLKNVNIRGWSIEDLYSGALLRYGWSLLQNTPVSWFFRTTFDRNVDSVILGSPHANAAVIVDAIESTTRMLVASLSEDIYGKAISGVPNVVRTFTSTINAIETFVQNVKEEPSADSDIEEVEIILARLKAGLSELLSAFQLYLTDVGLSAAAHRQAQNASRPGRLLPERRERGRENDRVQKQKELPEHQQQQQQPNGDAKKENGRAGKEIEKEKDKDNGERRPQKRLEPQDPARKKLFQNMAPKNVGKREMEMVR